jgi:hypothetical protein
VSRPRVRQADSELSWALRLPCMLATAAFVSCLLSAIERPPTRARSGPEAVRVSGVDPAVVARLQSGLRELDRRIARLDRSLARGGARDWVEEIVRFDDGLEGWEAWPQLRLGGDVDLGLLGVSLRAWPDTTADGFGLLELDPERDAALVKARLGLARSCVRGLAGALVDRH